MFPKLTQILVIGLETTAVTQTLVAMHPSRLAEMTRFPSWDPKPHILDPSGRRLFEELARRAQAILSDKRCHPECIAITMPGSIQGTHMLSRCSRLGVIRPLDVGTLLHDLGLPKIFLLRDVDCLAVGETDNAIHQPVTQSDYVYLFVDEGVGSSIFISGRSYRGAGHAGPIGRLIVEPDGAYNPAFRSYGPLEVFVGRPSLSQNLVNQFLTEAGKHGITKSSPFRNALNAAVTGDPTSLPYEIMKLGIEEGDPLAITVFDRAAHYLGLAISSLIIILNPPMIILAGGIITHFPSLALAAQNYARRYSWEHGWNTTQFALGKAGRDHQYVGAAKLAYRLLTDHTA